MEIRINREIRRYTEAVFFGLSMRQFLFSVLAVAAAAAVWFLFREKVSAEALSWLCIAAAAPAAFAGFFSWHGLTAGAFVRVWFRDRILTPGVYPFRSRTLYHPYTELKKEETHGPSSQSSVSP